MHALIAWLRGMVVALVLTGQATASVAPCSKRPEGEALLTPDAAGPARLASIGQPRFVRAPLDFRQPPQVSPDGKSYFIVRRELGLQFGPDPDGAPPQVAALPEAVDIGQSGRLPMPYAWQADSRAVFGASQARMKPMGGWALAGWRPLRIWRDGRIEQLPALTHPAGELDSLQWAGGHGLALAQFGTRGAYYRPERKNPQPSFAFVDAVRGKVLATIPFDTIPGVTLRLDGSDSVLFSRPAAVVVRPNGKLRAVMKSARGPWVILDQDHPPREAPVPIDLEGDVALSADGQRLLVTPRLEATGVICERNPNCPKPTPVEGPFAVLYDLESGQRLWELRATATTFWSSPRPAMSRDGMLVIVGLPPEADFDHWPRAALVSVRTGELVQTLCEADSSSNTLGFLPDGRLVLSGVNHFALYDLSGPRR